jgi:hypothetical protein
VASWSRLPAVIHARVRVSLLHCGLERLCLAAERRIFDACSKAVEISPRDGRTLDAPPEDEVGATKRPARTDVRPVVAAVSGGTGRPRRQQFSRIPPTDSSRPSHIVIRYILEHQSGRAAQMPEEKEERGQKRTGESGAAALPD